MEVSADILAELEGLRELFRADAATYVTEVVEDWSELAPRLATGDRATRAQAADLSAKAHRLAGTAATFGLGELSRAASALEDHLATLAEQPGEGWLDRTPGDALIVRLEAAIASGAAPSR